MSANLRDECPHGLLRRSCETCDLLARLCALNAAARLVFLAKGRHNTQVAMCRLGDLLGIATIHPGETVARVAK
jgi:hypothetical protein